MEEGIYEKYIRKEFEELAALISPQVKRPDIKKAFYIKSVNDRINILPRLISLIEGERHILISLMTRGRSSSDDRLDEEGIIEAVEIYYKIYLIISNTNEYYYALTKIDNFPINGGTDTVLVLLEKIRPFFYKLYFPFNNRHLLNM
jgi:hypothetical protein